MKKRSKQTDSSEISPDGHERTFLNLGAYLILSFLSLGGVAVALAVYSEASTFPPKIESWPTLLSRSAAGLALASLAGLLFVWSKWLDHDEARSQTERRNLIDRGDRPPWLSPDKGGTLIGFSGLMAAFASAPYLLGSAYFLFFSLPTQGWPKPADVSAMSGWDARSYVETTSQTSQLTQGLRHPDSSVREAAAERVAELAQRNRLEGSKVAMAKTLGECVSDENAEVQMAALEALDALGPEGSLAIEALVRSIESERSRWDGRLVDVLMDLGPKAKSAAPKLRQLVEHETSASFQMRLAQALVQIAPDQAVDILPVLIARSMELYERAHRRPSGPATEHEHSERFDQSLIEIVEELGSPAGQAVLTRLPELALQGRSQWASQLLMKAGGEGLGQQLLQRLQSADESLQASAASTLAFFHPLPESAIAQLASQIKDPQAAGEVQTAAATALVRLSEEDDAAKAAIFELLHLKGSAVSRLAAIRAIESLGRIDDGTAKALALLLRQPIDSDTALAVLAALKAAGPAASAATAELLRFWLVASLSLHAKVADVINVIRPNSVSYTPAEGVIAFRNLQAEADFGEALDLVVQIVPELKRWTPPDMPIGRPVTQEQFAARAVTLLDGISSQRTSRTSALTHHSEILVPWLIAVTRNPRVEWEIRKKAHHVLDDLPVESFLTTQLRQEDVHIRADAARRLGQINQHKVQTRAELREIATSDPHPLVRVWSAMAVALVSPPDEDSKDMLPVLIDAFVHDGLPRQADPQPPKSEVRSDRGRRGDAQKMRGSGRFSRPSRIRSRTERNPSIIVPPTSDQLLRALVKFGPIAFKRLQEESSTGAIKKEKYLRSIRRLAELAPEHVPTDLKIRKRATTPDDEH